MTAGRPDSHTRLYVLLGHPVVHSLSPRIHNQALEKLGINAVYLAFDVPLEQFGPIFQALTALGIGGNLTVPHKERVLRFLHYPSEVVLQTGACNTFWVDEGGQVCGENTDVEGFLWTLRRVLPGSCQGQRALLLGAGGAARAVAVGLIREGIASLSVTNRTRSRAERLVQELRGQAGAVALEVLDWESRHELQEKGPFHILVNATMLGMGGGGPAPMDPVAVPGLELCIDLIYTPLETELLRMARAAGIQVVNGLEMLLAQGAASLRCWTGQEVDVALLGGLLEEM